MEDGPSADYGTSETLFKPDQNQPSRPLIVTSTLNTYNCTIDEYCSREANLQEGGRPGKARESRNITGIPSNIENTHNEVNYFKSAIW